MRRLLMACAILLGAACRAPEGPRGGPQTPAGARDPKSALETLARDHDPGAQPAIWPQLSADVRARVEIDVRPDEAPEARLAAARERIGRWSLQFSTTEPEGLQPQLERAFEGVYLAEPLALAADQTATTLEARGLLWTFYRCFIATQPLLRSFDAAWGRAAGTKLGTSMAASELITSAGAKMSDRLAAEILRARAPDPVIDDILWLYGSRKLADGDLANGRAFFGELVRRSERSPAREDWVRVAHAYVRLDDPASAADAIARAKAAASPGDAGAQASIRIVEHDRDTLVRLLAMPSDTSPARTLSRFDLLLALDRTKEAGAVLEELRRARPKDARVRARAVLIRVGHGELTDTLVDDLRGDDLTDRTGEYWSMRIGAIGISIAKSSPNRISLDELAASAKELGAYEPGRAAVLSFLIARVTPLLSGADSEAVIRSLRASFDDGVALRATFPETTDADRVVLALALFTVDPAKGLQAALARPKTPLADDAALYLQRAYTVVTLVAFAGKDANLALARQAVEDLAPTTDSDMESAREALLGDVDVLAAVQGEKAAWARAVAHYETARKNTRTDGARLDNNLAYAAGVAGDAARATALSEASGRGTSERRWVPLLNEATAPGKSKEQQLAGIRAIAGPADAQLPALVNVWRAWLEPNPRDAGVAATEALAEIDAPFSFHKIALYTHGLETEGSFELGVGLRSGQLGHVLAASAYAKVWLVRPMPLSRADLEAKAKAVATPKPAPPKR